jgi:hypothetical protein
VKQKYQALQRETIEGAGGKGETLEVSRGDIFEADSEHSGILELLKAGTIQVYAEPEKPTPATPATKPNTGGDK